MSLLELCHVAVLCCNSSCAVSHPFKLRCAVSQLARCALLGLCALPEHGSTSPGAVSGFA